MAPTRLACQHCRVGVGHGRCRAKRFRSRLTGMDRALEGLGCGQDRVEHGPIASCGPTQLGDSCAAGQECFRPGRGVVNTSTA